MLRFLLLLVMFLPVESMANESIEKTMQDLRIESKQERPVIEDEYQRDHIVKVWAKKLAKIDDKGLGDVHAAKDEKALHALQQEIEGIVKEYHAAVKPILLNNYKLNRKDKGAQLNKVSLSHLFFPTKYNHKTSKPITGILKYKQDISESLFSTRLVEAGLLVNYPEIEDEKWVKDALDMEQELQATWRLYLAYLEGIKLEKKTRVDKVLVVAKNKMPSYEREKRVRKFVRQIQRLDETQDSQEFRDDLKAVLEEYTTVVKPILQDNIRINRKGSAAKANKGDLISLFYPNKVNHKTGLPISSKLKYKKDVSSSLFETDIQDVGYLVDNPSLKDDPIIIQALQMEKELKALLEKHKAYLKNESTFMY